MKRVLCIVAWVSLAVAFPALGHSTVEKSTPANNSTIAEAPKTLSLTFSKPVRLGALTLQKGEEDAQAIGPLPKAAATEVSVPMPPIGAGEYIIRWRAAGADGHVMSGKLLFKVAAPQ